MRWRQSRRQRAAGKSRQAKAQGKGAEGQRSRRANAPAAQIATDCFTKLPCPGAKTIARAFPAAHTQILQFV
jgi:hypothetical protein